MQGADMPEVAGETIVQTQYLGLGLRHVCPLDDTKLMEPVITTAFRGLQFDDIYTLQRNYGDPYEHHDANRNNDSIANAADIRLVHCSRR